jgi:hypothetical protein
MPRAYRDGISISPTPRCADVKKSRREKKSQEKKRRGREIRLNSHSVGLRQVDGDYLRKRLEKGYILKGVVVKPDKDDMRDIYGEGITAKEVFQENKVKALASVRAFPQYARALFQAQRVRS